MNTPNDGTPDAERRFGLDELVQLAFESAGGDTHAHERYQVLRRLLGVQTDMLLPRGGPDAPRTRKRPDEHGRPASSAVGAPGLAYNTVRAVKHGRNPFRDYREAPPDINKLYTAHNGNIEAAIEAGPDALLLALRRLATAALRSAEPDLTERTVTLDEVRAAAWNAGLGTSSP